MRKTWRDHFRPIIAQVIEAHAGQPVRSVRTALRKAFPAGPRQYHPYKVWLDECRIQLGLRSRERKAKPAIGQTELF